MKQYHHYCPMSYALDAVGQRWALHIVRDLLAGPRRFTDLRAGLPGIASNLLATRLKELEAVGIIEQQRLPPPARATVYALTPRGRELRPVVGALSQFGLSQLQATPPEADYVGYVALRGFLFKGFVGQPAGSTPITLNIDAPAATFFIRIADRSIDIALGEAGIADAKLQLDDLRTFVTLINRTQTPAAAVADAQMELDSLAGLESFLQAFQPVTV